LSSESFALCILDWIDVSQSGAIALDRTAAIRRFKRADRGFHFITLCAAVLVLAVFGGIVWAMADGASLAFTTFGIDFIWTEAWNPAKERFGALAPIYGTLVTSAIAMLIAVPVGIGIAIFLTELCPRALRRPIGIAVELLAGIPSIVYGIWGAFMLAPVLQQSFQPDVIAALEGIPILEDLFAGPPYGVGLFTAGGVLAIMVLPFIAAITRDVFETVPHVLKESAYALGGTTWEVIWNVVLPYARGGVAGGAMLSLGRALGETMAVTFVIGNAHKVFVNLFAPGTSISAAIANEFTEADGDLYTSSLIALGLILFFLTFAVLFVAQYMIHRLEKRAGGGHK
jgi:phosphate transport system permease protein